MWQFANNNPGKFTAIAILVIFLGFRLILEWICKKPAGAALEKKKV